MTTKNPSRRAAAMSDQKTADDDHRGASTNLAVLVGDVTVVSAPRELPDGTIVVQFDVATKWEHDGRPQRTTSPVSWVDPPTTWSAIVVEGAAVAVVGSVQRRFFRVAGATQSRTEVRADEVIPARRRRQVGAALAGVCGALAQIG